MAQDEPEPQQSADVIEPATSGRARCRACGRAIEKGALRFGEAQPNPFGEGVALAWLHLDCAALKRPEPLLAALPASAASADDELAELARATLARERLTRLAGVERDRSGRARCRECRALLAKGAWRVALDIWEEGRFAPIGFIHLACAPAYFGTAELVERLAHFAPDLEPKERAEIERGLAET